MSTFDIPDLINSPPQDTGCTTVRDVIDAAALKRSQDSFLISPHTRQPLTFEGLRHQARKITFELQQSGLVRGDKVAFLMDNGVFTAEVFLGTMYGGFVAVPLNVGAGESQLCYTLDHSEAKAVYVSQEYASLLQSLLPKISQDIRVISADVDGISQNAQENIGSIDLPVLNPEDPALLMYTSGSTGQSKAAVHTHRSILAHGRNSIEAHELTASDRSLLVLPLYHINAECVTLVPTLMSGGCVVVPHRFNVSQFWDWLDEYGCTWSAVVPTIVSQLLDWKDPRAGQREAAFKRIRFLRSSSAPLAPSLHREFLEKFNLLLIQAMGCSEGGNVFSNPLPPRANKIGSPGLPWGFETKIIDRQGNELPAGEPGEVLLRGVGLAQGYYKDEPGTAAAFDAHGWLHTGDLAYRDEDGYFFVVGRSKELIIKGGVNIAPRQIDDALESHPAVLEAAAIGVPDHYLGEDVVAFVVLRAGISCEQKDLLAFCEERLGLFKTPTRIHFVSDLPKGPSGKVQRLRLREDAAAPSTAKSAAPESEKVDEKERAPSGTSLETSAIKEIIAGVWKEVLGQTNVDRDSNFFELGGHSLLAVKCVSLLREKIAIPLSLSDFFENATIAHQTALIKRRLDLGAEAAAPGEKALAGSFEQSFRSVSSSVSPAAISPRDRKLPCPLTSAQRRVWFFEQLNSGQPLYNEAEAVRLVGELNVDVLERALNIIVERHEVLRSTIKTESDEPVVVVHDSWPLQIRRVDLSRLPVEQRQKEVDRLLVDDPREPYHLESRPGIRLTLIHLASKEHVLILMMHHIICDWSSEGVLWRELSVLYSSLLRGEMPAMPALAAQHGDYAVWQVQHDTEAAFSEDLDFWDATLRGAPQLLDLPADRLRPPVLSYRGRRQRFILSAEITHALRNVSQQAQTTLFTVFAAAFNTLLYRYTGRSDISLGIPIADRDRTEMQSMMGFLLHTQVLRTQFSDEMTFRELLGRVQKAALELYLHRAVPFDQVVRKVRPERNAAYATLFQVMLNWRDRDQLLSFIGLEGLAVESLMADARTAKFDLTLFATDCGDEIWFEAEYSTDLFADDRIARMFGHYQTLLEAITNGLDTRLADLPLLTTAEKQQLMQWNDTAAEYPQDKTLHELFEEQVERTPDEIAVEFEGERLTYRELNERANQLAHELLKHGAGPDDLIGVFVKRSTEMIVALLAVVKSGAAYVPLDPDLPAARLAYMIEDSAMRILLTQRGIKSSLPVFAGRLIEVDAQSWRSNSTQNAAVCVTADNLAYVIYTSGSTGKPKGVEVPRRALINFLWSMKRQLHPEPGQAVLATTTISFDIAGLEIWLPLLCGGRLIVVSSATAANGEELAVVLKQYDVRLAQATPVTWRLLLSAGWEGKSDLVTICGGEAMPQDLARELRQRVGCLWNFYGPTETTIWSTGGVVKDDCAPILIGHPVANTQCYILDKNRNPVPMGTVGELYIGGEGLARGYRNRRELTEQRFVPDPFVSGGRMYGTGDLARYHSDGRIECLGRTDHQVKIRGYRIELGEIESVLVNHPAIRQCVVIKREDRAQDVRLVAYFVPNSTNISDNGALRGYLRQRLPEYMVPSDYVELKSMPVTANGKINRLALPPPGPTALPDDVDYVPPQDEYESLICEVWADVLGLKRVGIRDNFFDLGGHSLLAIKLMLRLHNIIPGEPLPLRAVMEAPTVERFAVWLRHHKANERQFLVRMRPGTSERPPFFSVHGAGVYVLDMRALAMALPANLPFYCFEDKGLDGSEPFDSVEETARCYLEEIRRVQPHGPYYLGGSCYGGVVAFEMARRLEELGERVAALVLIDAFNPAFVTSLSKGQLLLRNVLFYMRRLVFHSQKIFTQSPREWLGYIRVPLKHFRDGMLDPLKALVILGEERVSFIPSNPIGETLKRIMRANQNAARKFSPRPYNGSALIFRAGDRRRYRYDDDCLGWGSVVRGGIECFEIKGCAHQDILRQPAVQLMAQRLDAKLKE